VTVHLAQPVSQAGVHDPAAQLVPDACSLPHAAPQTPQLLTSAETSFSQPLKRLPSQSSYRVAHFGWQVLPVQALVVTWAAVAVLHANAAPQPPQLLALIAVSTSQPLLRLVSQSLYVPAHCGEQVLLKQSLLTT
jgi:hypothetical protein